MKTMTCKQMGGPCEEEIKGATAEEMMDNGAKHITEEAAKEDDKGHKEAAKMMEDAKTDEKMAKEWEEKFHADFEAAPEDEAGEEKAAE